MSLTRLLPYALLSVLLLVQAGLWMGKGSIPDVMKLRQELAAQQRVNEAAKLRNERLQADIDDFQKGSELVEERARAELGMIREGEVLVQVNEKAL